jgi:hypothetical protein
MRLLPSKREKLFQMIKMRDVAGAQNLLHKRIQEAKETMLSTLFIRIYSMRFMTAV